MKKTNVASLLLPLLILSGCFATISCAKGKVVKDVDFPAKPIDIDKAKQRKGKACFVVTPWGTSGDGSIIEAAENGGVKKVHLVEYATEYEAGGIRQLECTYVYGEGDGRPEYNQNED